MGRGRKGSILFILLAALSGCFQRKPLPNIVLVVIDALRADHLGCYGYGRETSPGMDRLAENGILFSRTYAQAPWTSPSVASLFTGLYPSVHNLRATPARDKYNRLSTTLKTLPEELKEAGYRTLAVSAQPWVDPLFGFAQGFDEFVPLSKVVPLYDDREACLKGLELIRKSPREPFFLYLHCMGPHAPYDPPPPFDLKFDADYIPSPFMISFLRNRGILQFRILRELEKTGAIDPRDLNHLKARYDGEIHYTDLALIILKKKLEEMNLLENTVLIVTSDHGEAFYDHGVFLHGSTLYGELLHVPLIFYSSTLFPEPKRIGERVMLIDLYPTILELAGGHPPPQIQGESLLPLIRGMGGKMGREVFSEENHGHNLQKIKSGNWALIRNLKSGEVELYRVAEDPREEKNLAEKERETASRLAQRLEEWYKNNRVHAVEPEGVRGGIDEKTTKALRALGYLDQK